MSVALDTYQARMQRVLDHIDQHLDGDLDLDLLSGVAAFSKFHFHRQFTAMFGLSVHRYVQLARMRRASHQLAHDAAQSVTAIALAAGYDAPDAFARAFRKRFGQSPSSFRKSPDWEPWLAAFGPLDNARSRMMRQNFSDDDVTIRQVDPVRVAIFEHRGDPKTINATIQRFIAWRKAAGLSPRTNPTFNIWYSEKHPANPADYRMELCVGISAEQPVDTSDGMLKLGEIPGGRCAVLRVTGNTHDLEPAASYLYRDWLPTSGEEMRDYPIYCQRFFLDDLDQGTAADLSLPLK